jgi:hypothetical protein
VAGTRDRKGAYGLLVGKPEGRRQLLRPRHRWENNMKMDLEEIGRGAWIGLIWPWVGEVLDLGDDGNEALASIKRKFLLEWWHYSVRKKGSALCSELIKLLLLVHNYSYCYYYY